MTAGRVRLIIPHPKGAFRKPMNVFEKWLARVLIGGFRTVWRHRRPRHYNNIIIIYGWHHVACTCHLTDRPFQGLDARWIATTTLIVVVVAVRKRRCVGIHQRGRLTVSRYQWPFVRAIRELRSNGRVSTVWRKENYIVMTLQTHTHAHHHIQWTRYAIAIFDDDLDRRGGIGTRRISGGGGDTDNYNIDHADGRLRAAGHRWLP